MFSTKLIRIFTAVFMTVSILAGMFAGFSGIAFAAPNQNRGNGGVTRNADTSSIIDNNVTSAVKPVVASALQTPMAYQSPLLPYNTPFYGDTSYKSNKSISGSLTNLEDNAFDTCVAKNSGDKDELSGLKRTFERQNCKFFIGSK